MFSGIVEEYAEVIRVVKDQENLHLTLKCSFVDELKIDQSISHNGVCLTVVSIQDGTYTVTAMKETIDRSNIGLLGIGDKVNVDKLHDAIAMDVKVKFQYFQWNTRKEMELRKGGFVDWSDRTTDD